MKNRENNKVNSIKIKNENWFLYLRQEIFFKN